SLQLVVSAVRRGDPRHRDPVAAAAADIARTAAAARAAVRTGLGGNRADRAQRGNDLSAVRAARVPGQSRQLLGLRALSGRGAVEASIAPTRLLSVRELIARKDAGAHFQDPAREATR